MCYVAGELANRGGDQSADYLSLLYSYSMVVGAGFYSCSDAR